VSALLASGEGEFGLYAVLVVLGVVEEAVIPALTPSLGSRLAQARIACQHCWLVVVVVMVVVVVVVVVAGLTLFLVFRLAQARIACQRCWPAVRETSSG